MTQPTVMQIDGNYTGPVFAVKLNEVLAAHTTVFAGDLSPTAPVANMVWQDTSIDPPMFRRRNSTNSAWDTMGQFSNNTYYGDCTGAAGTTDTLATPRVISLSGDVTGSAGFDGSANAPIAATLKVSNASPGTYGNSTTIPVTTVNAKGLVTSVTNQPINFPVDSFNGRGEAVTLNSTDVFTVLPTKGGNASKFLRLSAGENTLEWAHTGVSSVEQKNLGGVINSWSIPAGLTTIVIDKYEDSAPTAVTGVDLAASVSGGVLTLTLTVSKAPN